MQFITSVHCPLALSQAFIKHVIVLTLHKKPTLDPDSLFRRPLTSLPFVTKVVKRVVARCFWSHSSSLILSQIVGPFHLTETLVLSVHNNVIPSINHALVSSILVLPSTISYFSVTSTRFPVFFGFSLISLIAIFLFLSANRNRSSWLQRSVLVPREFVAYTEEVARVIQERDIEHHLYIRRCNYTPAANAWRRPSATELISASPAHA